MRLPSARFALALALATAFAIPQPMAQGSETIARLRDVRGNVLVSKESGLGTGGEQAPLTKGMRVITTANAGTIVVFDNGCEVRMLENQRLEIEKDKPCAALIPQSILADAAGAGYGPLFAGTLVPLFVIGGALIDQTYLQTNTQPPVSPN
jgi:hypothetical protein